jgi:hypothetical protein
MDAREAQEAGNLSTSKAVEVNYKSTGNMLLPKLGG